MTIPDTPGMTTPIRSRPELLRIYRATRKLGYSPAYARAVARLTYVVAHGIAAEHDAGCRRGTVAHAPGRLDFKRCARCAELWRRMGGDPVGDDSAYPADWRTT